VFSGSRPAAILEAFVGSLVLVNIKKKKEKKKKRNKRCVWRVCKEWKMKIEWIFNVCSTLVITLFKKFNFPSLSYTKY
jgi:hypothetical protein